MSIALVTMLFCWNTRVGCWYYYY